MATTSFPVTMPTTGTVTMPGLQSPIMPIAPLSPAGGQITPTTPNTGTWEGGVPQYGGASPNAPFDIMQILRARGYTGPDPVYPEWNPYDISSSAGPTPMRTGQPATSSGLTGITPTTPNTGTWQGGVPQQQPFGLPTPQLPGPLGNLTSGGNTASIGGFGGLGPNPSWGRSTMPWAS